MVKRFLTVSISAFVLVVGAPLAHEAAAAPSAPTVTHGFYLSSADGSYYSGTVSFSNRSATVDGTLHAVGYCKRVYGTTYAGATPLDERSSSTHCNSTTREVLPLTANVRGGASDVLVLLTDENGSFIDGKDIYR